MDVLEILENHEARLRRLTKNLEELLINGTGGLKVFNSIGDFPIPGEDGFIYLDSSSGITYYWDGTQYLPLAHAELSFQAFATAADFPNPGTPGVLYLAEDTGELFFWNGTAYVNSGGGLKVFPDVAAFPIPGQPTFLYYAQLEKSLWYWDGTQYLPVVDPNGFIQNQNLVAQPANFWIQGSGRIDRGGLTVTGLVGDPTLIKAVTNYGDVGGDPPHLELINTAQSGRVWMAMHGSPTAGSAYFQLFSGGSLGQYLNCFFIQAEKGFKFLAGDGSGVPAPITFASGGINDPMTLTLTDITRNVLIGTQTDSGARLQVSGGALQVAGNTTDYTQINGGIFYRSDINKFRVGVNGLWKNLATEDSTPVTGHILYVDKDAANSTDIRTGISPYSIGAPFRTVQAAVNSALSGDIIEVRTGTYTEHITYTGKNLTFILVQAAIHHTHATEGVIEPATSLCSVLGIGSGCAIKNLGTGPAINYPWQVGTTGPGKYENVELSTTGTNALQSFGGGSSSDALEFIRCVIKGNLVEMNDGAFTTQKFIDSTVTGNINMGNPNFIGVNLAIDRCKITGVVYPKPYMRITNSTLIYNGGPGTAVLDFFLVYTIPRGNNCFIKNCTFKGNAAINLRDGGAGWLAESITRLINCDFELTGSEGFCLNWHYGPSAHRCIISNCMSNVDIESGANSAGIGDRLTIVNSAFDTTYKIEL